MGKQVLGLEPVVRTRARHPLEFHGNANGGWCVVRDSLHRDAVVVDVGLGEDTSFPESIIRKYGCVVHGFDPTPRAIRHVQIRGVARLRLYEFGLGTVAGPAEFFLPNDPTHVSGSLSLEQHLGRDHVTVQLRTIGQVFELVGADRVDLLKLDIEGTEFDIIQSAEFGRVAPAIGQLCVEFHHRWGGRGKASTEAAVSTLSRLGFDCAWYSRATNEEFLFVRT